MFEQRVNSDVLTVSTVNSQDQVTQKPLRDSVKQALKNYFAQLNGQDVDILIIVVRYYGGVNLGTSGLIVAYRTAAAEAIANAEIVSQFVEEEVVFDFPYIMMNDVMKIIKDMSPRIISQTYDNTCEMKLSIRKSEAPMLKAKFDKLAFKED